MTRIGPSAGRRDIDVRAELRGAVRHAFIVSSLIFAATLAIAAIAIAAVIPRYIAAKAVAAAFVLAFAAIGWWGRRSSTLAAPVIAFLVLGMSGVTLGAIATGGLSSFVTPLIIVVPLAAGFLIDVRAALAAAILAIVALIGIEAAEVAGLAGDPPAMGSALAAAIILVLASASFLSALYVSAVAGHLDFFARRTADRRSELESLIKSMPYAIAMFDTHMHFLRCSDRWLEDYGLEGEDVVDGSLYDLLPKAPEHWRNAHRRCLDGAVEMNDGEEVVGADGAARLTAWRARPWRSVDGAIGGVVISSRDISRERRPAQKPADKARPAEGQYQEAHEALRTIAGFAELLTRTNLEPYQAKMLQSILAASETLGECAGFSVEDRSTAMARPRPGASDSPLKKTLFAAARSIAPLADARGLRLDCRVDVQGGAGAFDEKHLIEIVTTLLLDAVLKSRNGEIVLCAQSLPHGGIEISIERPYPEENRKSSEEQRSPIGDPLLRQISELSTDIGGWVQVDRAGDDVLRTRFMLDGLGGAENAEAYPLGKAVR